ncbi:hypothetical protein GCM10009760_21230 [Kitasatospora kazusensis]|uniref:Acyl transferase domain-containing protein n=1 Tax=Kitasatospora kazusensis TaxID=407974 RepID=A0ABP5L232_9ACTN
MNLAPPPAPAGSADSTAAVRSEDIAIIGLACRFPGATTPGQFWRNLAAGVESVTVGPTPDGAHRIRAAAVLEGIEDFDASFFGFSPREAELLDPQHRVFLECAWEAIEDAGYHPRGLTEAVGVYGGTGLSTYLINHVHPSTGGRTDRTFLDSMADLQLAVGTDRDYLASRVSYKLDFTGPAVAVQAACATSLYAVHLACQAILNGECDLALAGAASIPVPQLESYSFEPGMVFSPDGHCRPFDARAEGTVFGSGAGVVLLKPLQDALREGDSVYAVIKGTAINNDGGRKVGFTAPTARGQAAVIAQALEAAEVEPATVGYVEAHGTATTLGDPIEIAGLTEAFGTAAAGHRCAVGSVKSNIGHLGWAGGIAGLIKTALALHHRQIPPSLNFEHPNPRIDFAAGPFHVNTGLVDWPHAPGTPRRGGVSAFGLGGANAHVVLEEAPAEAPAGPGRTREAQVVPLSARSPEALAELAARYAERLAATPEEEFADLAATAAVGRRHHAYRAAVVAATPRQAAEELAELAAGTDEHPSAGGGADPLVAALFSGQGGEYLGMGRTLYRTEPVFRDGLDECDAVLSEYLGAPIRDVLYSTDGTDGIARIEHAQPLLFAVQTALLRLWRSWGVEPTVAMGHSLGEYAAAWACGVFSLEDGLRLVAERGRLLQTLAPGGAMASVRADEPTVRQLVGGIPDLAVAAVNGPASTVVSGRAGAVRRAGELLHEAGLQVKELRIPRAGHCALMDPILDEFESVVRRIELRRPDRRLISNLTGAEVTDEVTDPRYWRRHLREPVRFWDGLRTLAAIGPAVAIELGAAPVLTGIAEEALPDRPIRWVPGLRPGQDDREQLLGGLAAAYAAGVDVDWTAVYPGPFRRRRLPTYPFQRTRHWIEAPDRPAAPASPETAGRDWLYGVEWVAGDAEPAAGTTGTWLICGGDPAAEIAEHLAALGGNAVVAAPAAGFRRIADDRFSLDFGAPDQVRRLLAELPERPAGVLSLLALRPPDPGPDGSFVTAGARSAGEGTLHLVQALTGHYPSPPRMWLATRGAQLGGRPNDATTVHQAALWGLARVAVIEHPNLRCTAVDLEPGTEPVAEARALVRELLTDDAETEVALGRAGRLVPRLLPRPEAGAEPVTRISPEGSYLVTGGLRGLGLLAAERLAAAGVGRLVLLGRSAPDAAATSLIERLRERGTEVVTVRADIADSAAARKAVAVADLPDRPLRGIVHAAGILDDGALEGLDWSRFERVLGPKAQGAWNLHTSTVERGARLDLFVLFSSTTGLIGNGGQANHAAANACLDALARHRRRLGLPALSVNWGAWSDAGYLAEHPGILARLARMGLGTIDRHTGGLLFDRLVRSAETQTAVAPVDWPEFLDRHQLQDAARFSRLVAPRIADRTRDDLASRLRRATESERGELIEQEVRRQLRRILGLRGDGPGGLDPERPLVDHGMDSLSAVQLSNALQRGLGLSLPPDLAFRHRTAAALTAHLSGLSYDAPAPEGGRPSAPALPAPAPGADGTPRAISLQQHRWLRLLSIDYGRLTVPIHVGAPLDRKAFQEALRAVVERHEVLRWRFEGGKAVPVDAAAAVPGAEELFVDLTALDPEELATAITAHGDRVRTTMPDPAERVPWTLTVLALPGGTFLVLLGLQHLEFDGVSVSVFTDDLRTAYRARLQGATPFSQPAPQYSEFIEWQANYLNGAAREDRAFFTGLYTDSNGPTVLPDRHGSRPGPDVLATTGGLLAKRWTPPADRALWLDLVATAGRTGVSPFSLLAAVYCRLIARITGDESVTIGTIVTGRPEEAFARTLGPFVAPFPVSVQTGGRPLAAVARQWGRTVAAVNSRCAYPPADLVKHVPPFTGLPEDTYFTDPFIMFNNYQREEADTEVPFEVLECLAPLSTPQFAGLDADMLMEIAGLFLIIDIWQDEPRFNFWYHHERFAPEQVAAWADGYLAELRAALDEL